MEKPVCQVDEFGAKRWRLPSTNELHREDGPAIEYADGDKYWFLHGSWHREDGPAVEYDNGSKMWCLHGKLHREDGPAVEYANGDKLWYLHGKQIDCETQQQFERLMNLRAFW